MTGFAIVSTTVAGETDADDLARALVEGRLAACVQIMPVASIYRWEGAIETAHECMLICKIKATDFAVVAEEIGKRHSYEVPEIVMTPIVAGATSYLDWLSTATRR